MSRYVSHCDAARQHALSIKYYHVIWAWRRIPQYGRRSWRDSRTGGRPERTLLDCYQSTIHTSRGTFSPLFTESVGLTDALARDGFVWRRQRRRNVAGQSRSASRLLRCRDLFFGGLGKDAAIRSSTARRGIICVDRAKATTGSKRRPGNGGENVWMRRGSIGEPSRMSFVHA